MVTLPINYEVPADILAKLATGELTIMPSVAVRDATGIVIHIKQAVLPTPEEGLLAAARSLISKNPKVTLTVVTLVAAAGTGAYVWSANKRNKNKITEPELPVSVSAFEEALAEYLEALQSGGLDIDYINRLISALDAVGEDADSGTITIEFSMEQISALIDLVANYTHEVARANDIDLIDSENSTVSPTAPQIVDLRRRLESQQQVFNEAA